jgi:hypothetical protein
VPTDKKISFASRLVHESDAATKPDLERVYQHYVGSVATAAGKPRGSRCGMTAAIGEVPRSNIRRPSPGPAAHGARRRISLLALRRVEMGLTHLTTRPPCSDMFANAATSGSESVGDWFATLCALQLGAAVGAYCSGGRPTVTGASRMGLSVLCYSLFTGLATSRVRRRNCSVCVSSAVSASAARGRRPWRQPVKHGPAPPSEVAGAIGMAANVGILLVGQLGTHLMKIGPDTWRDAMIVGALPGLLGLLTFLWLPSRPVGWPCTQPAATQTAAPVRELFRRLCSDTHCSVSALPRCRSWAHGAPANGCFLGPTPWGKRSAIRFAGSHASRLGLRRVLASATGGWLADLCGRRATYFVFSFRLVINLFVYGNLQPGDPWFMPMVFLVGVTGTVFFSWLPLSPGIVSDGRPATGIGLTYNSGRILTAVGILYFGSLMKLFNDDFCPRRLHQLLGLFLRHGHDLVRARDQEKLTSRQSATVASRARPHAPRRAGDYPGRARVSSIRFTNFTFAHSSISCVLQAA